ncbi:MAG: IS200/IS605 family transposase [Deltaproteobacteria bacterium]|jgi:putative transposase|nr:IS200/IS605 family transposase [Deltaproteobacteria bacterium]
MIRHSRGFENLFILRAHLVLVTNCRKKVLRGEISLFLREEIRKICKADSVRIIKGTVSKDYVHLFLSYPPKIHLNKFVQKLKEATAQKLLNRFLTLQRHYGGRQFWAEGYFCGSSGDVTDEFIQKYVEAQNIEDEDDTFWVD